MLLSAGVTAQLKCKIEHFSTEEGLSHDGVTSMIKDHEGFMWFGTWDGINRFDGHNFITYKARPGDNSVLKDNRVEHIFEDQSGFLWLTVYNKQVYRFDKKTETFSSLSDIFKNPIVKDLAVNKVIPFTNGVIWLSTSNQGLFALTGLTTAHPKVTKYAYNLGSEFSLPSNIIRFVKEDQNHWVWIGTKLGLSCLKPNATGSYTVVNFDNAISNLFDFLCFAENKNKIWFGTAQGNLVTYDKNKLKLFNRSLTDNSINGICASHIYNVVYASTSKSELITVNADDVKIKSMKMANAQPFFSVYEDKSGRLWIEPEKQGVIKFNITDQSFKYYYQPKDASFFTSSQSYSIIEYKKDMLWITMKGGGFGYYNPLSDSVDYFYDKPGSEKRQFSNLVTSKYLDEAGVLWLSTNDRGLVKIIFQRNDFDLRPIVRNTLNRSDNEVRGLFHDKKNRLWLASKSGTLYISDKNGNKLNNVFTNLPSKGLGLIYSIIEDKHGVVWLGTKGNGLFRAVPVNNSETQYRLTQYLPGQKDSTSLTSNLVYNVLEDKYGRIWVGTYGGGLNLITYQKNIPHFINQRNILAGYPKTAFSKIRHMQMDKDGNLWIATTDGLLILDAESQYISKFKFIAYRKIPGNRTSLGNNNVQYVFMDTKNRMWVCTSGGGLNLAVSGNPLESLKFKIYTTADGLSNDYILSCIQDKAGKLWLATENGLSKFDPDKKVFKNYDSYDGVPKSGFSEASCLKLPDGRLLFGCITGYLLFNPNTLIDHRVNEPMALTNLQINNQDINPQNEKSPLKLNINNTDNIALHYNQNTISIDYTVLDYRSGRKQLYAYRLDGFDNEWHQIKNQRKATYTNLPPGDYTFKVKSLSNDLYSNSPSKTLTIFIGPPPWRTWWAYLLYFCFTAMLFETVRRTAITMLKLRQRISVERRLADLKLSFFTNVSHELRTPLTLILNPIEEIADKEKLSAKGHEYVDIVRKNANRMVRFINQLLDLRKVQSGKSNLKISQVEIVSFVKKVSGYFKELAIEKDIQIIITANLNKVEAWIDVEKFDVVIYNLLANALKFTHNNKAIKIRIEDDPNSGSFTIQVIDQGTGVPEDHLADIFELYYEGAHAAGNNLKGTGIGLALAKEFVQLHHGKIMAINNLDGGLTVIIELPSGKHHFEDDEITVVVIEAETCENQVLPVNYTYSNPEKIVDNEHTNIPLVLLVEDNLDLRRFLALQLNENYRIEEAANGEEGLKKAMHLLPDLIISDLMMPKLNGIEMLDKLKSSLTTSHIPVILLTAKSSIENEIEGLKYGADYYITKPFDKNILFASIDNLLKQRQRIFGSLLNDKKTVTLSPGEVFITSKDEYFLKDIIKIVETGMEDPLFNIDDVAEAIGLGRTTFYKKFKSLTNLTPVEFVRDMRLKRGQQLLDAGNSSVSEIAYAIGFGSAGYFSTCFKEKYNLSPSEYIKSKGLKDVQTA